MAFISAFCRKPFYIFRLYQTALFNSNLSIQKISLTFHETLREAVTQNSAKPSVVLTTKGGRGSSSCLLRADYKKY